MSSAEQITCPSCGRSIAAVIPSRGDGTGLRLLRHNRYTRADLERVSVRRTPPRCEGSGRIVVRRHGAWDFD